MENTVYGAFKKQVEKYPDLLAVFDENQRLTYSGLDELSARIAALFPPKAKFVGIMMNHGVEMIAAMLAVLRVGAAYVPVEPDFPVERVRHIMTESNVDFIITRKELARRLPVKPLIYIEKGFCGDSCAENNSVMPKPSDPAYVLYTSGSTGKPKGVVVENHNLCNYARAFHHEFHSAPGDIMLQYSVCTFDIFVEEVFTSLLAGAAVAIPPADAKSDIHKLMDFVSENKITIISGFPYLLLEMNKLEKIPSSLRLLISGGDVLRAAYVDKLIKHVEIYNTYGPSETTVCASYFRCNDSPVQPDGTFSIGKPVLGVSIEILDENLQPVSLGKPGEICIFGEGVSRGYIGGRENDAFVTLSDGRRMYRSGDLGIQMPCGNFLFLRRKDTQVMILGKRVETFEVQNILCECDEVEKGAVSAKTDSLGLAYLIAYIVPKNKIKPDFNSIKKRMSKFLPPYMIPEFFVSMDSMPITSNGKIDEHSLPVVMKTGRIC